MKQKFDITTVLCFAALLAAIAAMWISLITTGNQKQLHLRLMAAQAEILELQIQATNAASPHGASMAPQTASNLTAQIDALRQEIHTTPPPQATSGAVPGISTAGPNMKYYLIRPGDTLTSIADDHDLTLYDLESSNPNIDPDDLDVGQRIKIPLQTPSE